MRFLDLLFSMLGLFIFFPIWIGVFVFSRFLQPGSPFFVQKRIGKNEKPFLLIKFRTMKPDTKSVGTHEVDPEQITGWGRILRKTKIDELPQLWNVLKGEMSLVGPRPCLSSQNKLITVRRKMGVFEVRPGITGLAQIQGIDMSEPELLAKTDAEMIRTMSVSNYFKYIFLTICGSGFGDRVGKISH